MHEHGTLTTLVFLLADGEVSWSLLLNSVSLLSIRWHSATRKHLFLYPHGDRSGLRKSNLDESALLIFSEIGCSFANLQTISSNSQEYG